MDPEAEVIVSSLSESSRRAILIMLVCPDLTAFAPVESPVAPLLNGQGYLNDLGRRVATVVRETL